MATITGGSLKALTADDIRVRNSVLNQLVDIIQEDVSGSQTRRAYQIFVTGGIGPGVTSSLYQTVYDQDFTLQTANPMFDMTVGLYQSGSTVLSASSGQDSAGKLLFPSQSLMMREKVNVYRQYASTLLGNADAAFYAPFQSVSPSSAGTTATNRIDNALFMSFKRLFVRDGIKRETFAIRMYQSASSAEWIEDKSLNGNFGQSNLNKTSISGSAIFTDIGASLNQKVAFGGNVGSIVNSSNTSQIVGLMFYDAGTAVFDMAQIFSGSQKMSGTIDAMATQSTINNALVSAGITVMGTSGSGGNQNAKFIPDFLVSASIDDIVDHVSSARFQSGTLTAMTFQNNTNINSTIVFCRASADEFNYSTNPTFIDSNNRIKVIDSGQQNFQRTFTMPTTVGLHDQFGNLLAVAKMSRPVEKNDEKDITFRIRLDF
jgi:hypothetical protein